MLCQPSVECRSRIIAKCEGKNVESIEISLDSLWYISSIDVFVEEETTTTIVKMPHRS